MNLRKFRISKGIQRKFIAAQIGISGKHLNDVEGGRVNLTDRVASKLASFYNLEVDNIKKMYEEGKDEESGCAEKTEGINSRGR